MALHSNIEIIIVLLLGLFLFLGYGVQRKVMVFKSLPPWLISLPVPSSTRLPITQNFGLPRGMADKRCHNWPLIRYFMHASQLATTTLAQSFLRNLGQILRDLKNSTISEYYRRELALFFPTDTCFTSQVTDTTITRINKRSE